MTATASAVPHAESVVFQLGRLRRGRLAVRLVHAGLFAAGGGAALLGAAMSAGYEPSDRRVAVLVLVGAVAAALIYLGDTARGADSLAAELDRKLQRDGALLTAWQAERRAPESPFTRLLAQREAAQLRGSQALRCCTPHWALAVMAPLLLFAWCASVAADEDPAPAGVSFVQRMERAANALQGAAQAARERAAAPEAQADPGAQRAQRAAELQRMVTRAKRSEAATSPGTTDELRREVAKQLARGGWSPAERLGLEQALDALEGMRRNSADSPGAPSEAAAGQPADSTEASDDRTASSVATDVDAGAADSAAGALGSAHEAEPRDESAARTGSTPGPTPGETGKAGPVGAAELAPPAKSALDPAEEVDSVQRRRRRARGAELRLLEALEGLEGWSGRVPTGPGGA